ncbi:MAG: Ycf66 family protein [Cyanobacteria bacterium J06592_8]
MLAQILAIAVGFGSFAVYMAAFFFPEVHRKNDFFWSGVGFFYALILWLCAGRITGAVLLGQIASVALLGWFGLQTLYLRRAVTPLSQQTPVPAKLQEQASGLFAVVAEEQSVVSTSPFESLSQEIFPSDAVESLRTVGVPTESSQNIEESSSVEEPVEETVSPSPTEVGLEDEPIVDEPGTEIPLTDEPVVDEPEIEIPLTDEPVVDQPNPEQPEAEIDFEDESVPEQLAEKVTEAKIETPPQPKGFSRLLQSITGVFNRKKKTDPVPLSSVETSVEPAAEDQSQPLPETSAAEQPESLAVEEVEVIETLETSPETEVEEITVTVEPEVFSSEDQEELTVSSEEPETIQSQAPTTVETETETETETKSSSSEDDPALKRPNPPDPKLKEAAQKQNSESTES